ncbi:hypothetical protein LZ554_008682 [Drepanopeziza brunnea f. sp. 'monogermtubi']|nr:hypothetical protein LZ554_008682 [Drepanopeziza brunnea f. sp. 'monogermtubi']
MNPIFNDIESSNDILLDSDEFGNNVDGENDGDVAIIDPEDDAPRADNFEAMKELVLTPLPELPPTREIVVDTWDITDWKSLPRRSHGPVFMAGGHPWRVLMFPTGNNVDHASFYLEQGYPEGQLPENFACCVQFALVLWNPDHPHVFQTHTAHHRFTKEEGDWGFTRFVEIRKLWQQPWNASGVCLADGQKAKMTAYVKIVEDETGVLWHNFNSYDSKQETGFVGLKNQGATCYLNSLVQSLYFTNAFRKAVYQIPTQNEEALTNSAYTLQRLFYQLQSSTQAVSTNELTRSFGWETRHIFEQQDVQELSRKLMERMEEKMKGTEAENVLPRLFCGKVRTYISCINVDYESRRVEDYWDIQLNVSGNKDIEASFKDYIQVELMDGENQYMAGDTYKLQDAKKGVIFETFPEVLHLQLKRFQYDIDRDAMMKINDRYEFPETFDAAPFLSDDADRSESYVYQLHGVLVHSGDLNAGHYYAFIKPNPDGWFYKYDDDRVTKATLREVLEDNFGGEYPIHNGMKARSKPLMRQNSAYMLVYIRQTRVHDVLLPVTGDDVPNHLQKRLDEEAAKRQALKKEREEAHLYLNVRVITDDTFLRHGGTDLTCFDRSPLDDPAAAKQFRYLRKNTLRDLATTVAADAKVDARRIRFWGMVNRQNKTVRPDTPFNDMDMSVEDAYQRMSGNKGADMRLWAELAEELNSEGEPIWPSSPGVQGSPKNDLIVLFLKEFSVEHQTLFGVGYIYISREKKVEDLVPAIVKKMRWPDKMANGEKVQLKLFEEIKPSMIEPMKAKQSLKAAELQDGDIVCFQLSTKSDTDSGHSITSSERNSVGSPARGDLSTVSDRSPSSLARLPSVFSTVTSSNKSDANSMITSESPSEQTSINTDANSAISLEASPERTSKSSRQYSDRIDDARDFYDFLLHRREVRFYPNTARDTSAEIEPFPLVLSSKTSYDQIAARVGEHLGIDPTHIRFWTINATTGKPKIAVKRSLTQTLQTILSPPYSTYSNNNQRNDSLFFEILDMSLSELDTKRSVKIAWISEGITKTDVYDLLVPKNGTIEDLATALVKKAEIEDEAKGGPIRFWEVHSNKIHKELNRESGVVSINEYANVIAERIPEDDVDADETSEFMMAFHFQAEPNKTHGVPFKFRLIPNEPFSETKKRLEKRTGMKGKNFEKIKFAVVKRAHYSKPQYLTDEMILDEIVTSVDDLLGLDHVDRTRAIRNGGHDLFLK